MAAEMVMANSWSKRPKTPPMKSTGMNTATREMVIETIVKPISREPRREAATTDSPFSMWRTMFSSITIASSTTKPTESVRASSVTLLMLKPKKYITAKVPMMAMGIAMLGMIVAESARRKRKITSTTKMIARTKVNFTSWTESRIEIERSTTISRSMVAGSWARNAGRSSLMPSTTLIVLVPGWRWMESTMARVSLVPAANSGSSMPLMKRGSNQLRDFSFSTLSVTCATSPRRTAAPLR